jgi:protein-tyrosine phosphatase
MDRITDTVAIGTEHEARDAALLRSHGIRSVVSLNDVLRPEHAAELGLAEVVGYRLLDGANDLRLFRWAVEDLVRLVRTSPPVLVHCRAGRSRSPAVAAGYLILTEGLSPDGALAPIAARRELSVAPDRVRLPDHLG